MTIGQRWGLLFFSLCTVLTVATRPVYPESHSPSTEVHQKLALPLREDLPWLNVDHPIKLSALKGKFVLLDFWTYCCINCMHIIPDLKKLEEKYSHELVVIGVHSAKFRTERETDNIKEAILRYGIEHPVVNDYQMEIWHDYGVKAWPTVVLIDPEGRLMKKISGENIFESVDSILTKNIPVFSEQLNRAPLELTLEKDEVPTTFLNFPGKVVVDAPSKRLFIADSGHHQIVISNLEGDILDTIGSGQKGNQDGTFEAAQFFHPQGLAVKGETLFIADTDNHLIRTADLLERQVKTLAGTGQKGQEKPFGDAAMSSLNSPWDLAIVDDILYIAMAGAQQIWKINLKDHQISLHAGSGMEELTDAPLGFSAFAQPSGITHDGDRLYVADSESSSVRSVSLDPKGEVMTLIGKGLFEYGDRDGRSDFARLQHCLGLYFLRGQIYVVDTYNNKIKQIDVKRKICRTFAGNGKAGSQDGSLLEATFNEPAGISYGDKKFYIADTNNHLIRVIDLVHQSVSTLALGELSNQPDQKLDNPPVFHNENNKDLQEESHRKENLKDFIGDRIILAEPQPSQIEGLNIDIKLPTDHKFLASAPSSVILFNQNSELLEKYELKSLKDTLPVYREIEEDRFFVEVSLYYCREGKEALCLFRNILFEVPINHVREPASLSLFYKVPDKPF